MALTCASARHGLCLMADAPIPLICGGNTTGPRHKCSKCRDPVHGNAYGVHLTDDEQLKQKGIPVPFDISCLPSEGQAEMKSFNNGGCILCLACATDIANTPKSPAAVTPANDAPLTLTKDALRPGETKKDAVKDGKQDDDDDITAVVVFANRSEDFELEWSCVKISKIIEASEVHDHCFAVSIDKVKVCF